MLNTGIERINSIFNTAINSRLHVLFGSALEDSFISTDYVEISLDEAMLRSLKQQGYKRVVFLAPHKAIYFLDEYSRNSTFSEEENKNDNKSGSRNRQEMRFLSDGPLGKTLFTSQKSAKSRFSTLNIHVMGDVFAIRLLDTIMRDMEGPRSAVVFMQAETTLRFFDDPRTLAGIVGEWEQLPCPKSEYLSVHVFRARLFCFEPDIGESQHP